MTKTMFTRCRYEKLSFNFQSVLYCSHDISLPNRLILLGAKIKNQIRYVNYWIWVADLVPECKQVEKFQSRKLGTKAVSKSAVFGVHTIPQSVPSHAVWKPALFCDSIVQFGTGIVWTEREKVTFSCHFRPVPASCEHSLNSKVETYGKVWRCYHQYFIQSYCCCVLYSYRSRNYTTTVKSFVRLAQTHFLSLIFFGQNKKKIESNM